MPDRDLEKERLRTRERVRRFRLRKKERQGVTADVISKVEVMPEAVTREPVVSIKPIVTDTESLPQPKVIERGSPLWRWLFEDD